MGNEIVVTKAKEHNLKAVDVTLPRDSMVVVTGVSGSGKSSLAFDTIFQEGQRKYIESLSSYARQFIGQMKAPEVEHISGISPTISIDQKTVNRNPRSTVGTSTGIYDFYRLLFARLGTPHCPSCGEMIKAQTGDQIADHLMFHHGGSSALIMAPVVLDRKGEYRKEQNDLKEKGYVRARIDGNLIRLEKPVTLKRYEKHTIEAVVDRIALTEKNLPRLRESMETAIQLTGNRVSFLIQSDNELKNDSLNGNSIGKSPTAKKQKKISGDSYKAGGLHIVQSTSLACASCGVSIPELEPRLFSFNSPQGACKECEGLGIKKEFDVSLIVPDDTLSVEEGAIRSITENGNVMFSHYGLQELRILAKTFGFNLNTPWHSLSDRAKNIILYGSEKDLNFKLVRERSWKKSTTKESRRIRGVMEVMKRVWNRWHIPMMEKYMNTSICPSCNGARLSDASLAVKFRNHNITHYNGLTVQDANQFFQNLKFSELEESIGKEILKEIRSRFGFLDDVGLGYLTIDRSSATLSGGEGQRIRLASQVGAGLQGVLYVLDEPSIGLHARDNQKLLKTLFYLKNLGNSLIVVEHDEETMKSADYILDIGPGAGVKGGQIVAQGNYSQLLKNSDSVTGAYLTGAQKIEIPKQRRTPEKKSIQIKGAKANNLQNVDVSIPLGVFVCVTGVSGSGKSTLIDFVLKRAVAKKLYGNSQVPGKHSKINGIDNIDRLVEIDQSPIGRTPRSNPVTYTKVFDPIRDLFANLPESKIRGYKKGRFSFNVSGGRCEYCNGAGQVEIEMQLLSNVLIPCEECGGKRFNDATLEVHYKGLNIYDVLEQSISEARTLFQNFPKIKRGLDMLDKIGLGYIKLGQPSTTLSGGEAQRVKLATELQKPSTGKTLYILDEPTTGLHFLDIQNLLNSLQNLVDKGNTVLVIEHNLDVIKVADYLIDMGPEGGSGGGLLVAQGTPEQVIQVKKSYTGQALKPLLKPVKVKTNGQVKFKSKKDKSRDIVVKGGCKHNLKNIDVTIPGHKLTVITGVSGSGKSSLAFGTLFAEGQRRFIESLSTYARRFLGRMEKGEVESIEGLAPAIAIDQKTASRSSKSTVATITEIYDYFRLLYARLGVLHCPECEEPMNSFALSNMVKEILKEHKGETIKILAPLYISHIEHDFFLDSPDHLDRVKSQLQELGFRNLWIDEKRYSIDKLPNLKKANDVYLLIDQISIKPGNKGRLSEALESAMERGHGIVEILSGSGEASYYSTLEYCKQGHFFLAEPVEPKNFSFNSHWGACETCEGLGQSRVIDPNRLMANPTEPLIVNGIYGQVGRKIKKKSGYYHHLLKTLMNYIGYKQAATWKDLKPADKKIVLYGLEDSIHVRRRRKRSVQEYNAHWPGLIPLAERWYDKYVNSKWVEEKMEMLKIGPCPDCHGSRLKIPYCDVTLSKTDIGAVTRMTVSEALDFFENLKFTKREKTIGEQILREIHGRLSFLKSVGLGYLGLDRVGHTLSGGEAQRIRLASQIGSGLEGVLYVLDEPTVGLHQMDTQKLIYTLTRLRDLGNTVVVVEHDPEMILQADWIIDMGPKAGEFGGEVVATGTPAQITKSQVSITGKYLSGKLSMEKLDRSARISKEGIEIKGAKLHNLKNLNLNIPLNKLVTFCGVSGSGKSSLVMDILVECAQAKFQRQDIPDGLVSEFKIPKTLDQVLVVDQTPLGSTPRSNPITYGKVYDKIRDLFAATPDAKVKGYTKSRFSINTGKGRCETCEGMGSVKMEMHFISDVWVVCDNCKGKRFNRDTLKIEFKGKNISDILRMRVEEAIPFFEPHKTVHRYLQTLDDVGLGYLRLGQSSTTFSGGEAQRIKLGAELARGTRKNNLYVFDEPTTGLHLADIHRLMDVLNRLVDKGHSVLVVEHQMNVIENSDWVIELGPEGGNAGGKLLFQGTPEGLKKKGKTPTSISLRSQN